LITFFSNGIAKIKHLSLLVDEECRKYTVGMAGVTGVLGWGRKATADKARNFAIKYGFCYISLEDPFIRSLGLGIDEAMSHGLIVDYSGIYYDVRRSSDLEKLIIDSPFDNTLENRALSCISLIRNNKLSKYNHAPDLTLSGDNHSKVLVVDQTFGDASVQYGLANYDSFKEMLDAAIAENPEADIYIKVHPDVVAGKKKGYLLDYAKQLSCHLIAEDINPWSLLNNVKKVYVVTSQLGFEALMAGRKVVCFGMPFYAGWGLTDDRQSCNRRNVKRSLEQVFYAAYIQYSRYINPYLGKRCQLEDTIQLISTQKQHLEKYRGDWHLYGFSKWKKRFLHDFLGVGANLTFIAKLKKLKSIKNRTKLLIWASKLNSEIENVVIEKELELWLMEDGFIRSVGLGADLVRPLSLVIDRVGIYYDASKPSELENYYNDYHFDEHLLSRAKNVREQLTRLNLTKYNVGTSSALSLPNNKKIILVPGQVETDASILKGCSEVNTNMDLLKNVRNDNPEAYIIYKPHPDVLSGARLGSVDLPGCDLADQVVNDVSITTLFNCIDEVHTMCSLTGFEALLRGISVTTYGMPFYAGWGLTIDKMHCSRRKRRLSIEQLVAGALILYPIYVEPESGMVCDIETVIELLSKAKHNIKGPSLKTRLYRIVRNIVDKAR